jgi:predicted enzyme related to lactoylglutathione lyase
MNNRFTWTDLSTFNVTDAVADYTTLFGWHFTSDSTDNYQFATLNNQPVAAVFPMPDALAKRNLPSFWMSYIHVENIEATTAQAGTHRDAIIEVQPQAFNENAQIALIRDPSGAGFTLYEGPPITTPEVTHGHVIGRYHHLPDIGLISSFYSDLFGWQFTENSAYEWPAWDITHSDGSHLATAEEVPESIRGEYRYWMPCFAVHSKPAALNAIKACHTDVFADLGDERFIVTDRQGANFMIRVIRNY